MLPPQLVPLPVRLDSDPDEADKSESCNPDTDSPKLMLTPVDPPASPEESSNPIADVARAFIVKFFRSNRIARRYYTFSD